MHASQSRGTHLNTQWLYFIAQATTGGLQPLVDLDVSPVCELNAGQFQAESFGARLAACGD